MIPKMRKLTHILMLFFLCTRLFGTTEPKPDSLLYMLNDPKTEKKLWALEELYGYYQYRNNDSSLKYTLIGVDVAEKAKLWRKKAIFLIWLGDCYVEKADYTKALDKYIEAEKMYKESKDLKGAILAINNIGYIYEHQNLPQTAIIQYESALAVATKIGDKDQMADSYNLLGSVYFNKYEDEKALENFSKALELNKELGNEKKIIEGLNNVAVVFKDMGRHDEALKNFFQLLQYSREKDHLDNQIVAYHNIGITYFDKNEYETGIKYLDSSVIISVKTHDFAALMEIYQSYSDYYSKKKDFEKAFEYFKLKFAAKDSLLQITRDKEFIEMSTKYDTEKKDAENKLLKAEGEKQKAVTLGISIGLLLVALMAFFIFRGYKQKQKANVLLANQNEAIREQKNIIEEKQKEILDSIAYAKRLQEAILPPLSVMNKFFDSVFICYQPKDIVAGDFYWMEHQGDHTFIAVADCTGHGVPGAMVSVICSTALNRAVLEFGLAEPGKILDKTRELVLETFSKSDKDVKDGMDISLLAINRKNNSVSWAGANNRLWYTSGNIMKEITADKQPIGKTDNPRPFTTHSIHLEKDSLVFLFTDGYADQFGGPKGKKFKYKQLKELLIMNASKNMGEQKEALLNTFNNWKGNLEQVDDVCVIGVKV